MNLSSLRPAANTAAAVSEALERARTALTESDNRTAEALDRRDGLLLEDDAKALAVAEKALAEARGDHERITAIVQQLEARLAAAQQHELVERMAAAAQDFAAADAARAAWWRDCGPKIRDMLREGHLHNGATWAAMNRHKHTWQTLERDYPDYPAEKLAVLHLRGDEASNARELDNIVTDWARGSFDVFEVL